MYSNCYYNRYCVLLKQIQPCLYIKMTQISVKSLLYKRDSTGFGKRSQIIKPDKFCYLKWYDSVNI